MQSIKKKYLEIFQTQINTKNSLTKYKLNIIKLNNLRYECKNE